MGADIKPGEVEHALTLLQRGKAPGPNGIPSEFFIALGPRISKILAHFANTVRDKGEFSEAQRQGKIVLLWKGKNKGSLPFYRPLTLLNRETSVIEAVITHRLSVTLPSCIECDQTGFLAKDGRRMHENIIKMLDALSYTKDKDIDACAISIDAVKAFDRVSRRLLFDLYDVLCGGEPGSNQPLTCWVRALMAKQERRVLVNGELTDAFTLNSGIPQGAILSVISYTLFSESLARLLLHGDACTDADAGVTETDGVATQPCQASAPTRPPSMNPAPSERTDRTERTTRQSVRECTRARNPDVPSSWDHDDRIWEAYKATAAQSARNAATATRNTARAQLRTRVNPRRVANVRRRPPRLADTARRRRTAGAFSGLQGIRTPSRTARLCTIRYADDIVLVLHPSEVAIALDICELWNAASGMARNELKTEGMWIGRRRHSTSPWQRTSPKQSPGDACYDTDRREDARITWLPPGSSLKVLGIMVGYSVCARGLWETIATAMFTQFRLWQLTKLGYLERVLVCKVMVWSKAFFVAAYYPPPPDMLALLTDATRCFIQTGYLPPGTTIHTPRSEFKIKPLFNDGSVSRTRTEGGLGMWDPALHLQTLLAKWVVLLLAHQVEEAPDDTIVRWTTMGRYYLTEYTSLQRDGSRGAYYLVDGRLRRPTSTNSILPPFWRHVLQAWHKVRNTGRVEQPGNQAEVLSLPLWSNCLINEGLTHPPIGWMGCGIHRIRDLWCTPHSRWYTTPELRTRALTFGASETTSARITQERVHNCIATIPKGWCALLNRDRRTHDGDLYAHRGACIDLADGEYEMQPQVWRAVVSANDVVRWKKWAATDYVTHAMPKTRIAAGAGPAGATPPAHPATEREIPIFTDGGCVENASVGTAEQLAGAGCVVLNGSRERATGSLASIYCPVVTDPSHPDFLGAVRGTNNTAELVGVAEGLLWLRDHDGTHDDACLYVDNQYAPAVVQARWGFTSNIALVKCIQHILVQVRSARNVRFEWVRGHSGDRWNDVADELATLGQHLDKLMRTGCTVGRHAVHAPRTALDYDPRHGGTNEGEHLAMPVLTLLSDCVPASDAPNLASMHRVTCTHDGTPVGFATHSYADQVERVTWGPEYAPVRFSTRTVRRALDKARSGTVGHMHVHAARLAQCHPDGLNLRWRSMWREGWSTPWPTVVQDMWWRMAAGGQYVAHQRRHHDPLTSSCRVCATHCDALELDTHTHLYYECPGHRPLWQWVRKCLAAVGHHTPHAAAFMLYGNQVLRRAGPPTDNADHRKVQPPELRALQYIRAATVEAFYRTRAASMRPEAEGEHPAVAVSKACSYLKGHVQVDFYAATRSHAKHMHLVPRPPGRARGVRPTDIAGFAKVWHGFVRVRRKAELEWLGPLHPLRGPRDEGPPDDND